MTSATRDNIPKMLNVAGMLETVAQRRCARVVAIHRCKYCMGSCFEKRPWRPELVCASRVCASPIENKGERREDGDLVLDAAVSLVVGLCGVTKDTCPEADVWQAAYQQLFNESVATVRGLEVANELPHGGAKRELLGVAGDMRAFSTNKKQRQLVYKRLKDDNSESGKRKRMHWKVKASGERLTFLEALLSAKIKRTGEPAVKYDPIPDGDLDNACRNVASSKYGPIEDWDVSQVTNMVFAFHGIVVPGTENSATTLQRGRLWCGPAM